MDTPRKPRRKSRASDWKRIRVFGYNDRDHSREIVWRDVVVNIYDFVCATPANYAFGWGKEEVISTTPHTVIRYQNEIPRDDWIEVHFLNTIWFNMMREDFEEAFGVEAPANLDCPF